MKKIIISFILISISCITNAQLKILTNGNVGIGDLTPSERLEINGGNCLIYGGSDLILKDDGTDPGDIVFKNSSNTEYGRIFSFSNALRIRANSSSSGDINISNSTGNISIGSTSQTSYKLAVYGSAWCSSGYWSGSDERYKTNINPIKNALSNLTKLDGKSYNLDFSKIGLKSENVKNTKEIRYGLLAQEVKEIFPDLVLQESDSLKTLSINYDGFIPILIEAIKELNTELTVSKDLISELQKRLEGMETNGSNNLKSTSIYNSEAKLFQNIPNPFTTETNIRFELPSDFNDAFILIYNMQGNQIMKKTLNNTDSQITINGNELQPGMYMYSLIVDNQEIDTLKMILTD